MTIGTRLQALRKERNLTQKEVADKMNFTSAAIGAYETGVNEPSIDNLVFLAQFYNVSVDFLLGLTDVKKPWDKILQKFMLADSSEMDTIIKLSSLSKEDCNVINRVLESLLTQESKECN